jgi:cyanate lyase
MARPSTLLRRKIRECGLNQEDLAPVVGRSPSYICRRLNNQETWTMADAEKIAEKLGIPGEFFPEYFGTKLVSQERYLVALGLINKEATTSEPS